MHPPERLESYAAGLLRRLRARDAALASRAAELRARAAEAAALLARELGVRKVWLFGSLAWGKAHPASDVDLLVEGLASADRDTATRLAEDAIGACIDLIRAEEAEAGLVERVRTRGKLLYGRE